MRFLLALATLLLACPSNVLACTSQAVVRDVSAFPFVGPALSTAGAPQLEVSCSDLGAASRGHWYSLSAAVTGVPIYITTCTANTNFDTLLELFSGTSNDCSITTPTCSQLADGVPGDPDAACTTMSFTPEAGRYYWVYVTGYLATTGSYSLNVDTNPPPAYFEGATEIPNTLTGTVASGSVNTNTNGVSIRPSCDLVPSNRIGKWFKYLGDDAQLTLRITSSWDAIMVLYNSTGCNNCDCTIIDNYLTEETVTINTVAGKNYYFFITSALKDVNGTFSYTATRTIPSCSTATSISVDALTELTVPSLSTGLSSTSCSLSSSQRGRWFKVTGATGSHYFTTCSSNTDVSTQIAVFTSCSGTSTSCVSNNIIRSSAYSSYCGSSQSVVLASLSSTSTYYIFVGAPVSSSSIGGNVTFVVTKSVTNFPGYVYLPSSPVSASPPTTSSSSTTNSGAIIGGALGGFFGFFIIVVLIVVGCTRLRRASVVMAPATVVVQQPAPIVTAQPVVTQTTTYTNSVEMSPYGGQPAYGQPAPGPVYGQPQQPGGYYT